MRRLSLEEYKNKIDENEDWTPGWQGIDEEFEKIYGEQEPLHFGSLLPSRSIFGGPEYLDGCSIYTSEKGHKHIVTYGMSNLYADVDFYEDKYSGWGYEMTFKVLDKEDNYIWVVNMLGNLARYTNKSENWFESGQYILGNGEPIKLGSDSKITSLIIMNDTEINTIETENGRVDFLQLVGITWEEANKLKQDKAKYFPLLLEKLKELDPLLVTDMNRTISLI